MSDLIYTFDLEKSGKDLFLVVEIRDSSFPSSRILYAGALQKVAKEEKELATYLLKEHCKNIGISPLSHQVDTTAINRIRIPSNKAYQVVKLLALSKKLRWKGHSLFFAPFAKVSLSYEAEEIDASSMRLSAKVNLDGKTYPLSSFDFLFVADPIWGIKDRCVFVFPDQVDKRLVERLYPKDEILEGKKKEEFIELYKDDEEESITWKGFEGKSVSAPIAAVPFLVLSDAHGAFASLWMDYGVKGKVAFIDPKTSSWRDAALEKSWEKDLLETDYCKKIVGTSHYYCPLDKVSKSLTFLLELGWRIFDSKGKEIFRYASKELDLQLSNDRVLTKGILKYGSHKVDLQNVIGAFNRRERFVDLGNGAIGLLDSSSIEQEIGDLLSGEITKEGLVFRKSEAGVLDSFFSKSGVHAEDSVRSFVDKLKSAGMIQPKEVPPSFQGVLFPYQQVGVNWLSFLSESGLSGLLSDEMGLGKTVQVLGFLSTQSFVDPVLIIAPTSLQFNWKKEWDKFLPEEKVYHHSGKDRINHHEELQKQKIILTSYALLRIDHLLFQKVKFSCVIIDEAQTIKNPESQIAEVCFRLSAAMRIAITGTPIENRWDDLWSLFHFLEKDLLGERKDFQAKMQASQVDERHLKQIKKKVKPFILRRTKEEVSLDLPEKILQTVWVEMSSSQRQIYEEWLLKSKQGLIQKVKQDGISTHRMEVLEAILRLRQICCHPLLVDPEVENLEASAKFDRVVADIEEVVLQGRKVIVFSQFTSMLKLIGKEIHQRQIQYAYLDGSTQNREEVVRSFQEDPDTQVFLMSLKAGGVGLNLTAADYVFLYDPWWNESAEKQAIDRAHRLGRKDVVVARRYVAAESIEEKMMRIKEYKSSLSKGLLDFEEEISCLTMNDLLSLFD